MLKKSIYNKYIECEEYGYVFNSLSGALIKLEKEKYNDVLKDEVISAEICSGLEKCGMLVSDDIDEIQIYNNFRKERIDSDSTLRLVIAPTLDCNFRCPYCFEKHSQEYMSETIQDKIVQFTENRFKTGRYKKLLISWYGGEPLLCIEIIEQLSEKLISLCKKYNVLYWAYMVTNGYLLDKCVTKLVDCQIKEVQVTIDGPKRIHNSRRILYKSNNLETYDNIISGVKVASENNVKVDIRVNLDLRNKDEIYNLFLEIIKVINNRKMIRIYPGKLFCMPSTESNCDSVLLNKEEFVRIQIMFSELSDEYGFRKNKNGLMPKVRPWYCPAPFGNSIVISPNGKLYACWNDIGQESFAIGDLLQESCIYDSELKKWRDCAIDLEEKCKQCDALPLCGGGCLRSRVHDLGMTQCDDCYSELKRILIREMDLK